MDPIFPVRHLEPIPVEVEGRQLVVLRDPFHFLEDTLTVTVPVYLLMTLMDGERDVMGVCEAFREQYGGRISGEDVEHLVEELDGHGLFLNDRFEKLRVEAYRAFRDAPVRLAVHAGAAYAADAEGLRREIDGYYEQAGLASGAPVEEAGGRVAAIIAPHIDPRVGGVCAARAYAPLRADAPAPDLFVIFGTAHQPGEALFCLTEKPFETPFGRVEVDREVVRALREHCPFDLMGEEYLHKYEHSIEFQLLFLQHLYADRHRFCILPILVGSFHDFLSGDALPSSSSQVEGFTVALRRALGESGRRVCFVAGADLSHRGRKFGDERDATPDFVEETKWADAKMLSHVQACRREDFFRHLQADGDMQKVCGLPPIYTMLNVMGDHVEGRLVSYDVNVEKATESFVSYAGMVFHEK